jgi:TolB-like protein/Flp pilus assembly protein TadD
MATAQRNGHALREELERVLSSACFVSSERTSKLLRFLVERRLEGRENELKEATIGVEVFGRSPDYDPKLDSTVRSEAVRLRARLSKYYSTAGSRDPIMIDLPKGGYVPIFREPEPVTGMREAGRKRLWLAAGLAGCVMAAAVIGAWLVLRHTSPIPIAVLPLANLSQDPANEYFADGLTDEIIRTLSILDGLAVRSQTSSFVFKGKAPNLREAGRQLQADYILEGSVMRAGRQVRIDAQLVRARDDFPVWSGRFDRELSDVFAIQDEISRGIVNGLRLKLGRGRRRYETSAEAYDLYLRALASHNDGRNEKTIGAFEQAISKDPSFAPAYAGLAAVRAYRSGFFSVDRADEVLKMRAAAEKAIQLDPMLAEAHDALGVAYSRDAQWQQAEKSFRRALELDPNRAETLRDFAIFFLWPLGRTGEALKELQLAAQADPLSVRVRQSLAYLLPCFGRYDEAATYAGKMPQDAPFRAAFLGRARFLQERTAEAIQILETAFNRGVDTGSEARGFLGYAYARTGRREEAERIASASPQNPFNLAVIYAGLGDKERAMEAMERAASAGPFRIGRQLSFPELALIRGEPRMKALRKKVGLPE